MNTVSVSPAERPLSGACVSLTRPQGSNEALRELVVAAGADVLEMPLLVIEPTVSTRLTEALAQLSAYDGVLLTSANAAAMAAAAAAQAGIVLPDELPWYAIGERTAAAAASASLPVITLQSASGEAFAEALVDRFGERPRRLLFLHGAKARSVVPETLRAVGHQVDAVVCYDTVQNIVPAAVWEKLKGCRTVYMPLFSPSAARSLAAQLDAATDVRMRVVAIGETTAAACRDCHLKVAAIAAKPSVDSVMTALIQLQQHTT